MDKKTSSTELLGVAARGSLFTLMGTLVGKLLFFTIRVAITRLFGEKFLGMLMVCMMVTEITRITTSLGLPKGGMRFLSLHIGRDEVEKLPGVIRLSLVIPALVSLATGVGFYFAAPWLAAVWFNNPELIPYFQMFAFAIPFATLLRVGVDLSRGFNTTRYAVVTENIFMPVATIILFIAFYLIWRDFSAVVLAMILANAAAALLIIYYLRRQLARAFTGRWSWSIFLRFPLSREENREILTYSIPLFLTGFTAIILNSTDIMILGAYVPSEQVGVYGAGVTLTTFFSSLLIMSVNSIFAPMVAAQHGREDNAAIVHLYVSATRWLFFITLPMLVLVIVLREPLLTIFGPNVAAQGQGVMITLALGQAANCLTGGVGYILSMTGYQKRELWLNILVVALNIALNLLLIPRLGMLGSAVATAVSQALVNGLRLLYVYNLYKVQPFSPRLIGYFLLACLLTAGSFLLPPGWAVCMGYGAVAAVVMVGVIPVMGLLPEDREVLQGLLRRTRRLAAPPPVRP